MIETLISIAINTMISVCIAWLVFGGPASVARRALVLDAAPQSFMIVLMSVVVPGVLTRRRMARGQIAPIAGPRPRYSLAVRAIAMAMILAVAGVALHAVLLGSLTPQVWDLRHVITLKATYGAALAAAVTPTMLRYALRSMAEPV
ncbi:MAG TPA: hypothetical protein VK980_03625 [Sphingomonas sp.]|nr:hypothetical protein [Sphingomonas sp.]